MSVSYKGICEAEKNEVDRRNTEDGRIDQEARSSDLVKSDHTRGSLTREEDPKQNQVPPERKRMGQPPEVWWFAAASFSPPPS